MEKWFMIIAVFSLLVIVGCGGNNYTLDYDPYQGTEGIDVGFIDNAPPDTVLETQQIPIGLYVKNNGAYDVSSGIITIAVEEDYMSRPYGNEFGILLKGRSIYNEEGEEETKMFYSDIKKLDKMSELHEQVNIIASVCYKYANILKTDVCIDPDIFNLNNGVKPCSVEPLSFSGQGSPVGITNVEETITRDKDQKDILIPTFEITIENMGTGRVVDSMYVNGFCGPTPMPENSFNVVYINAVISEENMVCQPNPVKLFEGKSGKTVCKPINGFESTNAAYTTLLSLSLDYGYTFSLSKSLAIQNLRQ